MISLRENTKPMILAQHNKNLLKPVLFVNVWHWKKKYIWPTKQHYLTAKTVECVRKVYNNLSIHTQANTNNNNDCGKDNKEEAAKKKE